MSNICNNKTEIKYDANGKPYTVFIPASGNLAITEDMRDAILAAGLSEPYEYDPNGTLIKGYCSCPRQINGGYCQEFIDQQIETGKICYDENGNICSDDNPCNANTGTLNCVSSLACSCPIECANYSDGSPYPLTVWECDVNGNLCDMPDQEGCTPCTIYSTPCVKETGIFFQPGCGCRYDEFLRKKQKNVVFINEDNKIKINRFSKNKNL